MTTDPEDEQLARLLAELDIIDPPPGWVERATRRFQMTTMTTVTTPVAIIHLGGCHLTRLPIAPSDRSMALSGLAAGLEREQWGWDRIEPAEVRSMLIDHRIEEVILTDSESPYAALIAQGLDPLVLRLARAESDLAHARRD